MNDIVAIEVIEKEEVCDRIVVAGQLKNGKVSRGMVLSTGDNDRFEVAGVGFVSPELHAKGRCALTLIPLDGNDLAVGATLRQVVETTSMA
jgi:hypothetical protein